MRHRRKLLSDYKIRIIQRLPESKTDARLSGVIPRLVEGKPDLSGPWQPNAIRENVNLIAAGVKIPFLPNAKAIYDSRISVLGKDDPEVARDTTGADNSGE